MSSGALADTSAAEYWSFTLGTRFNALCGASASDLDTLNVLDDELAALRTAIRAIYWQRYNLAPVSRLPFELLAHIFSILSIDEPSNLVLPRFSGNELGWIKVVHVCSRWREVALASPIFLSPTGIYGDFLHRGENYMSSSQIASVEEFAKSTGIVAADTSAIDYWNRVLQTRISTSATSSANGLHDFGAFDRELVAFCAALSAVRRQRNLFLPISRLSSDILSYIFFILAEDEPISQRLHQPLHIVFGWIKVSHVCSRWRQVTLETPMLWAHVIFGLGYKWALESVKRAKHAPLVIHRSVYLSIPHLSANRNPLNHKLVDFVAPSLMSHTQILDLGGDHVALSDVIPSLVSPVPILERINLKLNNMPVYDPQIPLHLPQDLFSHHAPKLRDASFDGFVIPWGSPAIRHLTSLSVTFPDYFVHRDASILPSREVLNVLSGMPSLKHLSLIYAIPPLFETGSPHTITLPHLSSLKLKGEWLSCMAFLADIQVPDTATLDLHFECEAGLDKPVDLLLPFLEEYTNGLGNTLPLCCMLIDIAQSLIVHGRPKSYAPEIGSTTHWPIRMEFSRTHPQLSIRLETMAAIIRAIHVHELSTLYLTVSLDLYNWDLAATRDALRLAHGLTHVYLSRDAAPLFCALLDPIANTGSALMAQAGSQKGWFPKLQFIHIDYVNINQIYGNQNEFLPIMRELLPRVLEGRQKLEVPVQVLDIKECVVSREWVDQLKNIVPTVTWDGKTVNSNVP